MKKIKKVGKMALLTFALVAVTASSTIWAYMKFSYRANLGSAQTAGVSFNNAASWGFFDSPGMPAKPTANPGGGWYFDFPVATNASKTVNWVTTQYFQPLSYSAMTMDVEITTTGDPVFNYNFGGNNGSIPASARFIMYYRYGNGEEHARWWSNPLYMQLKPGVYKLTVPLKPNQWSSVYGKKGDADANATAWFNKTLASGGAIGITFGGGSFFGHGVNISTGSARFTVKNFGFTNITLPSYAQASLVNSASFKTTLAKDGLATIFGTDLATAGCIKTVNFETSACGAQVLVNNTPQKLTYVSPTQINFLLPSALGNLPTVVTKDGASGPTITGNIADTNPALFSSNSSGTGLVSVQHWSNTKYPNGTQATLEKPIENNGTFVLYLTGLGSFRSSLNKKPTVKINNVDVPAASITFADKTSPGLDQINISNFNLSTFTGITAGTKMSKIKVCGGSSCSLELDIPFKK